MFVRRIPRHVVGSNYMGIIRSGVARPTVRRVRTARFSLGFPLRHPVRGRLCMSYAPWLGSRCFLSGYRPEPCRRSGDLDSAAVLARLPE